MGARGPAPEPLALKLLKGSGPGRDSQRHALPVLPPLERGAPDPPPEVAGDALASKAWKTWAASLETANVLRPVDMAALSQACMAYAHYQRLEKALAKQIKSKGEEAYLSKTREGTPSLNPLWRARDQADNQLRRALRECGLTPSAEHVLAGPADKSMPDPLENPFA